MTHRRAVVILTACTFIWGASFAVNKMAYVFVSPLLLLGSRSTLASTLLSPAVRGMTRSDWQAGAALGLLFGIQLALFASGLDRIPSNRAAFLFSAATPLVPVVMLIVERRLPRGRDLLAVSLAVVGTWFLTQPGGAAAGLTLGDALMLAAAACGAVYVVWAGHMAPKHEPLRLLAAQMPVMALVGFALSFAVETPRWVVTPWSIFLVLFLSVSSIATFGGQLAGQRLVRPTEAAIIFALEPVCAAAAGYVSLGERLVGWQWLGAGLILAAMFAVRPSGGAAESVTPPDTAPSLASTVD